MFVSRWTVDYGDGPQPVVLPHAWGQDVSVEWEGPAVYRTTLDVPRGGGTLRFGGVAYAAEVFANGASVARHEGIWDAFDAPLPGGRVEIEVRVVKNGGPTYPVAAVASGGLPALFNAFGGIYREVELLETPRPLLPPPARRPPLPYLRAVVHRGWYPDLGHPNPDEHTIRRELRDLKALGFNAVKFAGWVPPHRYLDALEDEDLLGWLELPMGHTLLHPDRLDSIAEEIERIVLQYRHHPCLVVWTLSGGSFGGAISDDAPKGILEGVRALTGSDWVAIAPLDGSVPTAYRPRGTFDDVRGSGTPESLDALQPGPYPARPILLGEYGGDPVHRDLARMGDELPYWASALPELNPNPQLPRLLEASRFAVEPTRSNHRPLLASSPQARTRKLKKAIEDARARAGWIHGYAVEGLRDTPVASTGLFDDWGQARLSPPESAPWNGPVCVCLLPQRRFGEGGFSTASATDHFPGEVRLALGVHADPPQEGALWWRILDEGGRTVARGGGGRTLVEGARLVAEALWPDAAPGTYRLEAGFGPATNGWDLWVVKPMSPEERAAWRTAEDAVDFLRPGDEGAVGDRSDHDRLLDDAFLAGSPFAGRPERLDSMQSGATLDPAWLAARYGTYETLLTGIDSARHEPDLPILVRAGGRLVTTLAPDLSAPAGIALYRWLFPVAEQGR